MRRTRILFSWSLILILILIITIGLVLKDRQAPEVTATKPSTKVSTPSPVIKPSAVPSGWQEYTSAFGFSFWYPPSWGVDDSEITQFSSLHAAFVRYSNLLTVYSNQAAETDPSQGPSITINVASQADEEALIKQSFQSSADWVNKSSTGLPPGITTSITTIDGLSAIRLSGFSVVQGEYQAIYFYDPTEGAVVRFDYAYNDNSDVQTLDAIAQSFSFSKHF